jgi:hypothetical protein
MKDLGIQVLSLVGQASKPLLIEELQQALAVDLNNGRVSNNATKAVNSILASCAGLVTFEKKSGVMRLTHMAIKEHLIQSGEEWFLDSHFRFFQICATYITCVPYPSDSATTLASTRPLYGQFPFLSYALRYCFFHLHLAHLCSPED